MLETSRVTTYTAQAASQARLSGSMPSFLHNPHVLIDNDSKSEKALKRQFLNDPEPVNGKRATEQPVGKNGNDSDNGEPTDDASNEDADDEEDDEDEDEDEDEEPAVSGPVGDRSIKKKDAFKSNDFLKVPSFDHRAGLKNSLKRSLSGGLPAAQFTAADLEKARASSAVLESADEGDDSDAYPRSNIQRSYSNSSAIRRETEKDESDYDVDDLDCLDSVGDLSDDDIEKEEELAIMEELASEPTSPIAANSTFATISDLGLDINGDLFSDSDFDDLPMDSAIVYADRNLSNFVLDFPSIPSSPVSQPHTPPASPTPYGLAHQVVQESFEIPTDTETDSEIEDIEIFDAFIKPAAPVRRVTWEDSETDDDDVDVWDAFFGSSTEEEAEGEEGDDMETGAEADAESDGDTTEEEEDLPMPTPKSKSIICRASDLPIPKNVLSRFGRNCSPRPVAGNFLADGSRPICIINGTNKTYIVPTSKPIENDDSEVEMAFGLNDVDVPDSDIWEVTMELHDTDPTFGGMTTDSGLFNAGHIVGPPEAFMSLDTVVDDAKFMEVLDEYMSDGTPDEEDSEGADILKLDDLLELSEDEDAEMSDTTTGTGRRDSMSEGQPHFPPETEAEAMLSRWDQVSVTAFRKRQIAHQQRLTQRGGMGSPSQRAKKLVGPDTTMTPIRKRRLKKRVVSAVPMGPPKKRVKRDEDSFYDAIF